MFYSRRKPTSLEFCSKCRLLIQNHVPVRNLWMISKNSEFALLKKCNFNSAFANNDDKIYKILIKFRKQKNLFYAAGKEESAYIHPSWKKEIKIHVLLRFVKDRWTLLVVLTRFDDLTKLYVWKILKYQIQKYRFICDSN